MPKLRKHRSLVSLALLRLSESDIRSLHATISEMSSSSFFHLIRDIEHEIENAMSIIPDRTAERAHFVPSVTQLYNEINRIRKQELRISVQHFATILSDSLSSISKAQGVDIPRFEPRKGLETWIGQLVRAFSEQDVFHALMRLRHQMHGRVDSDWKLR